MPRRGTIHDIGNSMSYKRLICKKRKIERKSTSLVAQKTNHSLKAVEQYNLNLDRVAFCLEKNLSVDEASFVTGLSKKLIIEYQILDQEIKNSATENTLTNTIDFDDIPF